MLFGKKPTPIRAEALASIEATENGPAKFSAKPAYSGGILKVAGYRNGIVVDLKGLVSHRKVIANLDHDSSKRVGHIIAAENDGRTLSLDGALSASTPFRDEVVGSHQDGFGWDVSVEIQPSKIERIEAGQSVSVNGQTFQGPIEVARKSTLYGLAFVGAGADEANAVRIAAMMDEPEMETTEAGDEAFAKFAEEHGFNVLTMSEDERAALEVLFMSQSSSDELVTASFDPATIRAQATKGYDQIETTVLMYEDNIRDSEALKTIKGTALDRMQSLKRIAAEQRYNSTRFQVESKRILADLSLALIRAERPQGPSIISSSKDNVMNSEVIEAKLVYRVAGEKGALRFFDERTVEAARKSGIDSFPDICKVANHQNGNVTHDGIQATVINAMRPIRASSGPTNIDVPTILNNVANKVMLFGYEEYPSSIFDLAEVKSVRTFKDETDIRMSAGENLAQLAPGGEIKHGKLDEENVFTRKVDTYAQMRMIDRRDLVNDDLRAFDQLQKIDGAAAKRTLINLFWQVWMTGAGSFWHANNNNLLTTATALSIANLGKGISAMRKQVDSKGNVLDMQPTYLIVPPELESTAKPIVNSAQIIGAGSVSPDGNPMFNIVKGVITEPRLSNAGYTNNSLTAWYLSAQKQAGAIVISFLEGKDSPTVETELADFNKLGLQMRVYHDFGVSLGDPKAAFKATGAA